MIRTLVVGVGLLFSLAFPTFAQYEPTFPGCSKCGVAGYVDLPATTWTVSNAELLAHTLAIQGWGFECVSGNPVDRVDLFVEDEHHPDLWKPVPSTDPNGSFNLTQAGYNPRPDVERAYVQQCPAIYGRWNGVVRWIDSPLPLGAHRFLFVLWRGPYHTPTFGPGALIKTLNVVE